ncbi:J domain-containing protein [Psidium guajava]|nr:J domain-containing protein [Psidium guajava]
MASLARNHRHRLIRCFHRLPHPGYAADFGNLVPLCPGRGGRRPLSTGGDSARSELDGRSAYELLGVPETSSFAEIKASFRRLAKETHPDLAGTANGTEACQRFVQIVAAYEILSDAGKRAHYDRYLWTQKKLVQKLSKEYSVSYVYRSHTTVYREMEVVEWLKWYRYAINDILSDNKVVTGTGYFDILEGDFYSAIRAAYYGPWIDSLDLLPDRFEAEERSFHENLEVLHLVSGRYLFGMVCLVNKIPELASALHDKLNYYQSVGRGELYMRNNTDTSINYRTQANADMSQTETSSINYASDAYKDLELLISGRVVATATRLPPQSYCNGIRNDDADDRIYVFLNSCKDWMDNSQGYLSSIGCGVGSTPLGTIVGLGTSPEEGSCFVYDSSGTKTHVIMKHRTFLVKHMHWYQCGDNISICECRSTRARLPPSKFWLFEPRCAMHDIGGWYVETFGRDEKSKTVPSQRYWDGVDVEGQFDKRLHPAVYLLALAYRTLDIEDVKRRKQTVRGVVEGQVLRLLRWCKKLV